MTDATGSSNDSEWRSSHAQIGAGVATMIASAFAVKFEWCTNLCALLMPYKFLKADEYVLVAVIVSLGAIGILAVRQRQLLRQLSAKYAEQRATYALARTDFLTGIPNRLYLSEYVAGLNQAVVDDVVVLVLDLDDFKRINDNMGHAVGDEVLKCVANRLMSLRDRFRNTVVFRLGGDEFLIMIRKSETDLSSLGDTIRKVVSAPIVLASDTVTLSVSIGIVPDEFGATPFAKLFAAADLAMLQEKRNGRTRSNSAGFANANDGLLNV